MPHEPHCCPCSKALAALRRGLTGHHRGWILAAVGAAAVLVICGLAVAGFLHQADAPAPSAGTGEPKRMAEQPRPQVTQQEPAVIRGQAKPPAPGTVGVATVKPADPVPEQAVQTPQPAGNELPLANWLRTEAQLRAQLLAMPEVSLDTAAELRARGQEARKQIQDRARQISQQIQDNPDGFVQHVVDTRPDLAGLPWRRGKDCQLTQAAARTLGTLSLSVRQALDDSKSAAGAYYADDAVNVPMRFWKSLGRSGNGGKVHAEAVPALNQMLPVEHQTLRLSFVEYLGTVDTADASKALAQRAVFDLDRDLRGRAIALLKKRPMGDYAPVLVEALRYPWAPAAEHAAEALGALQVTDAVPHLVRLLDEPDPGTPFRQDGTSLAKPVLMVREVVRVNHLRNCMLCHAPSVSPRDEVLGPVPTPGEPLPPSARVYYSGGRGTTLVRADVTYLRQDFSVTQPVDGAGAWPAHQRYDYLVRVRPLTEAELHQYEVRQAAARTAPQPAPLSAHKRAILHALRTLTGQDAGTTAQAWQERVLAGKDR
jgi:hypothetical protein